MVSKAYGNPDIYIGLERFANNKGEDQPAHPCSLISTFVLRLLEGIISKLATSYVSLF